MDLGVLIGSLGGLVGVAALVREVMQRRAVASAAGKTDAEADSVVEQTYGRIIDRLTARVALLERDHEVCSAELLRVSFDASTARATVIELQDRLDKVEQEQESVVASLDRVIAERENGNG